MLLSLFAFIGLLVVEVFYNRIVKFAKKVV